MQWKWNERKIATPEVPAVSGPAALATPSHACDRLPDRRFLAMTSLRLHSGKSDHGASPFGAQRARNMGVPSPKTTGARLWGDQEVQHTILRALHNPFVRALGAGELPRCDGLAAAAVRTVGSWPNCSAGCLGGSTPPTQSMAGCYGLPRRHGEVLPPGRQGETGGARLARPALRPCGWPPPTHTARLPAACLPTTACVDWLVKAPDRTLLARCPAGRPSRATLLRMPSSCAALVGAGHWCPSVRGCPRLWAQLRPGLSPLTKMVQPVPAGDMRRASPAGGQAGLKPQAAGPQAAAIRAPKPGSQVRSIRLRFVQPCILQITPWTTSCK